MKEAYAGDSEKMISLTKSKRSPPLLFWTMAYKIVMPGIARKSITNMLRMTEQKLEAARVLS